jgi:TetR/AcrR family transcriptional repressor of nem operon
VGRPRSFDEDKALEAAAKCFWARGYEATSVRDLSGSMGIAGASIYNAYGGKRALFAAALDHYCNRSMRDRIARLEAGAIGLPAIDAFFQDIVERSLNDCDRKGCFLVNAALEIAPHDGGMAEAISGYFAELKSFFLRNILAAQKSGEAPPSINPNLYAAHLLSVLMGIRVLARCNPDRAFLEAAAAPALQRLHATFNA